MSEQRILAAMFSGYLWVASADWRCVRERQTVEQTGLWRGVKGRISMIQATAAAFRGSYSYSLCLCDPVINSGRRSNLMEKQYTTFYCCLFDLCAQCMVEKSKSSQSGLLVRHSTRPQTWHHHHHLISDKEKPPQKDQPPAKRHFRHKQLMNVDILRRLWWICFLSQDNMR